MSINLLPWRKQKARKAFFRFVFITAAALIISLPISLVFYLHQKQGQLAQAIELASLQKELAKTPRLSTTHTLEQYASLKKTLVALNKLRASRTRIEKTLLEIIEKTPSEVSLSHLSIHEKQTLIQGFSANKKSLESFMESLSRLFKAGKFSISLKDESNKIQFNIRITHKEAL